MSQTARYKTRYKITSKVKSPCCKAASSLQAVSYRSQKIIRTESRVCSACGRTFEVKWKLMSIS